MKKTLVLSAFVLALQFAPVAHAEDKVSPTGAVHSDDGVQAPEKGLLNKNAPAIKADMPAPKDEAKGEKDCDCKECHHDKNSKHKGCKHCEMHHKDHKDADAKGADKAETK